MDYLWSPWRYQYVSAAEQSSGCVLCAAPAGADDPANHILYRASLNYVMLNRYPYTSGHLMIVPYVHVPVLEELAEPAAAEMMILAREAEKHLRRLYNADGINIGMNIGKAAGAGVAGHVHLHVLPRWVGDTNFMTAVGETRVLPEDLSVTYERLRRAFNPPQ